MSAPAPTPAPTPEEEIIAIGPALGAMCFPVVAGGAVVAWLACEGWRGVDRLGGYLVISVLGALPVYVWALATVRASARWTRGVRLLLATLWGAAIMSLLIAGIDALVMGWGGALGAGAWRGWALAGAVAWGVSVELERRLATR